MKKFLFIPVLVFLAACGGEAEGEGENLGAPASTEAETSNLPKVVLQKVERGLFKHYIEVQGNVEAEKNVLLYAEAGGNIRTIHVQEGQKVSAGQRLVSFDMDVIGRNIAELETRLELANFAFEKQKNLWDQKIGSEIQYRQAENQKKSLEASLATMRAQQSKAVINAPFAGTVDEIMSNPGEMVPPGMPVLRLINLKNVSVEADVPESYLSTVRAGSEIILDFPALRDVQGLKLDRKGTVTSVGKYIKPANRTFKVRVDLDNPDEMLVPNLLAVMKIRDYQQADAVMIPEKYIRQNSDQKNYVFIEAKDEEGRMIAKKVDVEVLSNLSYKAPGQDYALTVVTSGLLGGEMLITEGSSRIQNGQHIEKQ